MDTDFRPNYAIEQALAEVKRRGLLKSVKRVAIVGPGLDFTDKDSGFDYYPLQTLQPFALIDSLVRLRHGDEPRISSVSVFDISPLILDHVSQATARARSRQPYTLQLVLDRTPAWNQPALNYWRRLGRAHWLERCQPNAGSRRRFRTWIARAVRIRPEIVTALDPRALNIVSQHVKPRPGQGLT